MVEPCTIKASHNRHVSTRRHLRYIPLLLAVMVIYSLFLSIYASAKTSISQSYATTDKLSLGSIVSLKNNTTGQKFGEEFRKVKWISPNQQIDGRGQQRLLSCLQEGCA